MGKQLTKERIESRAFVIEWLKRGYREDSLMTMGILMGCQEACDKFGSFEKSLHHMNEFMKSAKTEDECVKEAIKMSQPE